MNVSLNSTATLFPLLPDGFSGAVNGTPISGNGSSFAGGPPSFLATPAGFPRVQTYSYFAIILVGMFTNSLNLAVLHRMPRKPMFIYLKGLAFTDLTFVICVALLLGYVWNGTLPSYTYCLIHCHVVAQLFWACGKASSSITAALGVERTVLTLFPLKAMKLRSVQRVWVTIFIVILLCIASQTGLSLMLYVAPYQDAYYCGWQPTFFTPVGQTILLVNAVIFEYTVPLVLLACNICLIITIAIHKARRRSLFAADSDQNADQVDHKMNGLLISMSILTLVANTPTTLIRLVEIPDAIFSVVRVTSGILYVLDRAANFFLYCLVNAEFRGIAKDILVCGNKRRASSVNGRTSSGKSSVSRTKSTGISSVCEVDASKEAASNDGNTI